MYARRWTRFVGVGLTLVLMLILAACAPAPAQESGASDAAAPEAGAKGGDLVIAFPASSEPASLDGHIDPYQPTWLFNSFVADPLIVQNPDGEYMPALATSWESSEDGLTWTFNLRDDVVFQDNTPFNAEAVKYNIERIQAPETQSAQMANDLGPIASVDVVDEFTVQIVYDEPWVTLLDAVRRMPIWSPTAAEEYGLADFDNNLVGTGPFLLEEWVPNDRITFTKWADYGGWNSIQNHEGPAYLDSITITFIGEDAVLGSVVSTGDANIARELPSAYIEDYQDQEGFDFMTGYQAGTGLQMVMNVRNAPLNILELRQALLYGTDQAAANDLLYDGTYLVSYGPVNTVHPCYWEGAQEMYGYDPARATELLEGVGYMDEDGDGIREAYGVPGVEDGTPLALRWSVLHHEEIGEAIQGQWRQIGVDLLLEVFPAPFSLSESMLETST